MIAACGLDAFYRLRGDVPGVPAAAPLPDAAWLDSPGFAERHVHRLADGAAALRWRVGGIRCAACVWLLERLPHIVDGVHLARVDLGDESLAVRYDPTRCTPSAMAAAAARLGYALRAYGGEHARGAQRRERRAAVLRTTVAAASAVGAMHIYLSVVVGGISGDLDGGSRAAFRWMAAAAALPALTYGAWPFWRGAWASVRARRLTLDTTTALVLALAIVAGAIGLLRGTGDLYLDAAAMFVALLLGGRLAFDAARAAALRRLSPLDGVLPAAATRIATPDATTGERVPAEELAPGELALVQAGETVPCDGTVAAGSGRVAAAILTGEPRAVVVAAGDEVWAGARCAAGPIAVRVRAAGVATRVAGLLAAARAAPRPRRASAVDRMQAWFAPAVLALAALAAAVWAVRDPARALDQAVAMVLVCCPCALGLAAPLVGAIATARAARHGLLLRDADALDRIAGAGSIVFDKTGTLTAGAPAVAAWHAEAAATALLPWALAAEERSPHPVAAALAVHLRALGVAPAVLDPTVWREVPGRGVACATPHGALRLGNAAWLGLALPAPSVPGASVAGLACGDRLLAWAELRDAPKIGAAALVASLRGEGRAVHLCSGDDPGAVAAVAAELGIDPARAAGGRTPEDKARDVAALRTEGPVAMVGDGVNDAAALAGADAAIAVRGGLAASFERCDAYVLGGEPADLLRLFAGARAARAMVRLCLAVSLAYNAVGVVLVLAGVWGPLVCAIAMPASSLTVLALAAASRAFAGVQDVRTRT